MSIKAVLFDLDATLLPMDQNEFIEVYFKSISSKMAKHGYEPKKLIEAIWSGIKAMALSTGKKTNEQSFWDEFKVIFGDKALEDIEIHKDYYENDFDALKSVCGYTPKSNQLIKYLKSKGIKLILATNPVFPAVATEKRIGWAGLDKNDFDLVTTFENSHYCKPNPNYYKEILEKHNLKAEECVMVGNDALEDMVAEEIGINVFLLTDNLLNSKKLDISKYPQGSFEELHNYLNNLI